MARCVSICSHRVPVDQRSVASDFGASLPRLMLCDIHDVILLAGCVFAFGQRLWEIITYQYYGDITGLAFCFKAEFLLRFLHEKDLR